MKRPAAAIMKRPAAAAGAAAVAAMKRPAAAAKKRPAGAVAGQAADGAGSSTKRTKVVGCYAQYKGGSIPATPLPRPKVDAAGSFKAISWNVAGLRAFLKGRRSELQKLVRQERPSVIGFLETKLQEGIQVDDAIAELQELLPDYCTKRSAFACSTARKGYSGVAFVWRKDLPEEPAVAAMSWEDEPEGRVLHMNCPGFHTVLAYVPNSGDGLQRLDWRINHWDPSFRRSLQKLAREKPVLVLGDLNVAHRDEDIWNLEAPHIPKSASTTPEERASFGRLLETGFVDGFAHLRPAARGAFTYWSVRARNRAPNRGLRLDYAVASQALVEGCGGVKLLDAFHLPAFAPAGDHCPVGATVRLP